MKTIAIIVGTRPEIIKFAPLLEALKSGKAFKPIVISTGQHSQMAEQAFNVFGIEPDTCLNLMKDDQSPLNLLAEMLPLLGKTLSEINPCGVMVQGDTTTALAGAMSAYHLQLKLAHVEAGLRTYNPYSPFPEEGNRRIISTLAQLHFCPTEIAVRNLAQEGITSKVYNVGNTVVDAVEIVKRRLRERSIPVQEQVTILKNSKRNLILVTGHRRENFAQPLRNLCHVLLKLVEDNPDLEIVYPVHLNPNVRQMVHSTLSGHRRIHLLEPVDYPSLLTLLDQCCLVITDSGGIQEEAPSFGKQVIVTRNDTERTEAITAGLAELVSLDNPDRLYTRVLAKLSDPKGEVGVKTNPFGDGQAAGRIVEIVKLAWL